MGVSTEMWKMLQYGMLALALFFLLVLLILAVRWDVVSIINQVSGRTARKEISEISKQNETQSGILQSDSTLFQEMTSGSLLNKDLQSLGTGSKDERSLTNKALGFIIAPEKAEEIEALKEEVVQEEPKVVQQPENVVQPNQVTVTGPAQGILREEEWQTNLLDEPIQVAPSRVEDVEDGINTNFLDEEALPEAQEADINTNFLSQEAIEEDINTNFLQEGNEDSFETGKLPQEQSPMFASREDLDTAEDTNLLEEEIYETSVLAKLPELSLKADSIRPVKLKEIGTIE